MSGDTLGLCLLVFFSGLFYGGCLLGSFAVTP